jgi:mannose-6-phosphate isomerase-like protein (cupin superfamily)
MKNIRVIKTGINVSKILAQLKEHPEDWESQKTMDGQVESLLSRGYDDIPVGVLQLIVGGVTKAEDFVGDSEICIPTKAFEKHTTIVGFLKRHFKDVKRCGFLSLPVGGEVGLHIDEGTYYQTKDRYHLSIQGRYEYTVGDEKFIVEPGTLMWFNNKLKHGTQNIGDCTRITFVFDVPHSKSNP